MDTRTLFLEKSPKWDVQMLPNGIFIFNLFIFFPEVICTPGAMQGLVKPAPTRLLLPSVHHHPSKWEQEGQGKALSCLPEVVLPLPIPPARLKVFLSHSFFPAVSSSRLFTRELLLGFLRQ